MYKLILADDHPVIREGVRAYLEDSNSFSLEGVASNAEELLQMVTTLNPDIIMTDLDMPGSNVFEVLKKMKEDFPHIKKVIPAIKIISKEKILRFSFDFKRKPPN